MILLRTPSQLRFNTAQIVALSFVGLVLCGALALALPIARQGAPHHFLDDLFTATSAICVTGLMTLDLGTRYSPVGMAIVACLVQIGGLGYMSAVTLAMVLVGKRISLRDRLNLAEATDQGGLKGLRQHVLQIARLTLMAEFLGSVLLATRTIPLFGWPAGLGLAVFFAVCAPNNAGFSPFPDGLARWQNDPVFLLTICVLIIFGGLGYNVVRELMAQARGLLPDRRWTSLVRIVVPATAVLLLFATVAIWLLESANPRTLGPMPLAQQGLNAFFMAVQPRTAGFNSIDTSAMRELSQLLMIPLMFVGTGPGGTGGGIKLTTLVVLLATLRAVRQGRHEVVLTRLKLRIDQETVYKAVAVLLLSLGVVMLVSFAIAAMDPLPFDAILFEVVSAFGTAGLSLGITPHLSAFSKLVIIFTLLAGRIGPLMILLAVFPSSQRSELRYPEETLMLG